MKRVTFTFTMDFPDDLPDEKCIECGIEVVSQDGNWPDDDAIQIETIPDEKEAK